ncbi:MAG TPA: pyridoxal 5'-phosphate synthase glutaminase subunit PdxT [Aeromicrobium sp.]|nr:pyridoxal 5'-phosphate synthase glutaminase subunit PdxT [Aeromicrobium sp.]
MSSPAVGVLALQGDVREHLHALSQVGACPLAIRRASELDDVDGLILPGGESTTVAKLARTFEVFEAVADRIKTGMPTFGTCAGMVLLADRLRDGAEGQETFGGLDITVRRNAFGRQVDSFESDVQFGIDDPAFDQPVHAVFIRAPWVEDLGEGVDVLAAVAVPGVGDRIVAVQQGPVMATSFHPEVSDDLRLHRYFLDLVTG